MEGNYLHRLTSSSGVAGLEHRSAWRIRKPLGCLLAWNIRSNSFRFSAIAFDANKAWIQPTLGSIELFILQCNSRSVCVGFRYTLG